MIYLDQTDVDAIIQDRHLQQIIGQDQALLDRMEIAAWDEMRAYMRSRYDVDFIEANMANYPLIKQLLGDIMIYHLLSRVAPKNAPEFRYAKYRDAITFLEQAAEGRLSPGWQEYTDTDGNVTDRVGVRVGGDPANNWYY